MSIKEIAEKVGVSVSTVSRVLSKPGYKCSSKELREQIFAAAREMNYVPNESAKNLRSGENKKSEPYRLSIICFFTVFKKKRWYRLHEAYWNITVIDYFSRFSSKYIWLFSLLTRNCAIVVNNKLRKCVLYILEQHIVYLKYVLQKDNVCIWKKPDPSRCCENAWSLLNNSGSL